MNEYLAAARRAYPGDDSLEVAAERIGNGIAPGDYCWMYDTSVGEYYCAVVTGPFVYREGHLFDEFDLHLLRPCRWARVGAADAVPGTIRRAFAASFGTVTRLTTGLGAVIEASEIALGVRSPHPGRDLFAAASPDDFEDLVGLYLQARGWSILASTSKASMANYEFVLASRADGTRAGVQVKSGRVGVYRQQVAEEFDRFFVFLADADDVLSTDDPRIQQLGRRDIEQFATEHWHQLPRRLQMKWKPS